MKKLLVLLFALQTLSRASAADLLPVAVFDFTSREESLKDIGAKVSTLTAALLSAEDGIITVERAELDKALGEQELGLSGTVASDTAAKVGHLTGAKALVTGNVFKADKNILAVVKIIGVETGRVYGETATVSSSGEIQPLAEALAKKIANTVRTKGDTLVGKTIPREQRREQLTTKHKAKTPLAVSVVIPERHFGSPVNDPAAQTELLSLLKEAGFEIVDAQSAKKPDIEITGEAFSAFALRKAQIFACKARIEIKAQRRSDGKILFVGSQTSVAADIAEQTAAKTALEIAALDIAGRLLPKLGQ
jgi:hypothetical protein